MPELQQSLDVEAIVDRVRSLRRDAANRMTTARVELFAKAAVRSRVTRDLDGVGARFDRVLESGLALRVFRAGQERAGFAAASGLTPDVVRWAVATACTFRAQASACEPSPSDAVAAERWDLDAASSLPSEDALTGGLLARPRLEWIEAGTTVEVLIGAEGWLAARRRHRLWALGGGPGGRLVAQRGFAGWERLLDGAIDDSPEQRGLSSNMEVVVLTPDAAASVVSALVEAFHGAGSPPRKASGGGWEVMDDPIRTEGLAGGSFDDAGFPAVSRVLATGGVWVGRLDGPGTFRRVSFREPPTESATNLFMPSGTEELFADRVQVVGRCRVLRPSAELWVMEIDLVNPENRGGPKRRWIRVQPESLLAACTARLGRSRVTSAGPVVPALRFEGLAPS